MEVGGPASLRFVKLVNKGDMKCLPIFQSDKALNILMILQRYLRYCISFPKQASQIVFNFCTNKFLDLVGECNWQFKCNDCEIQVNNTINFIAHVSLFHVSRDNQGHCNQTIGKLCEMSLWIMQSPTWIILLKSRIRAFIPSFIFHHPKHLEQFLV